MGSSNQNETRKEHRLRDIPPLGPMQKKSRVSEHTVAWGHFSLELGYVQVPLADFFFFQSRSISPRTGHFYTSHLGVPSLWISREEWKRSTEFEKRYIELTN